MANRTLLQMDKTTSQNKDILQLQREWSKSSNLDRNLHLSAGRYSKERTKNSQIPLRNSTGFERECF
jgi:hypothetical protein